MEKNIVVRVTFEKPTNGWWDGGAKNGGDFTSSPSPNDGCTRWGCWELNHWFDVASGKSLRASAAYAKRRLVASLRVPATVEVVEE